ncbi:MAG: GNAT family N-acetyltransferase [Clostridiales bacterium]|nr:GNAT family N-acetyltransferase [Clostridiales bacterium]
MLLETNRLILRPINIEDREFVLQQFSDIDVTKYLFDEEPIKTIEEADEIINSYIASSTDYLSRWILILKENNSKIGTCGFHCYNNSIKFIDIGYDLVKDYWGKGLMNEAVDKIIQYAKLYMDITSIKACIYEKNINSIKFIENLGFEKTRKTETTLFRGKDYLHYIYELAI